VVGPGERIAPADALALFGDPTETRVRPGMDADLVLLAAPLRSVLSRLRRGDVVATIVAGDVIHDGRGTT
jgi:predicted amidohydrolase YtcJ